MFSEYVIMLQYSNDIWQQIIKVENCYFPIQHYQNPFNININISHSIYCTTLHALMILIPDLEARHFTSTALYSDSSLHPRLPSFSIPNWQLAFSCLWVHWLSLLLCLYHSSDSICFHLFFLISLHSTLLTNVK